jgi:septal ring factor EnvC (AmiA/AmiB activator)
MRKISLWLFILTITASLARAQDATQQQLDQISGKIQDLQASLAEQGKRIDALEKKISDLQDKLNQPDSSAGASADDLKKLAEQVQEIDKKRQADNELILKELEKLGGKGTAAPAMGRKPPSTTTTTNNPAPGTPQKGYDYTIQEHDTVAAIAKAYRSQGVKVTTDQILAANPGLKPNSLVVGKKIFIPDPNAK